MIHRNGTRELSGIWDFDLIVYYRNLYRPSLQELYKMQAINRK